MGRKLRALQIPYFSLLLFAILFSSCEKDETSGVPAYVKIDEIVVETDYKTQGSTSSNLADAWFYANGDHLGVYELPTEIPVLESGNTNLTTFGGIKISGISSLRQAYPFYDAYRTDTLLVEEETVTIRPVLRYTTNSTFAWLEDFDDISISLDTVDGSQAPITRILNSDSVFEGKGSMAAFMNQEDDYFFCQSTEQFALPKNGDHVYLEFDYKTDRRIQLLIRNYSTTEPSFLIPVLVVRPKLDENGEPRWNKMYAYLTPYVSARQNSFAFDFYFESWLGNDESDGYIMLDNIKLVY